jgi:hypothetical protein
VVTTTETVCVVVQPPLSANTVYVALAVGVTTADTEVPPPAFALQVYDAAPEAVSVELEPEQTAVGVAVIVTVGAVLIFTVIVCVEVHPPLSPVTV